MNGKIVSSLDGLTLQLPSNIGLDYFKRRLYDQSVGFDLLELIFFDETLTHKEISEKLFISVSSVKRLITKVRAALILYGIDLRTKPFEIVGDERLIRNFYTMYFQERYNVSEWPFSTAYYEFFDKMIERVMVYYGLTSEQYDTNQFRYQHAVDAIRAIKGYRVEEFFNEGEVTRKRQIKTFFHAMEDVVQKHNISEEDITIIFNQAVSWKYYLSPPFMKQPLESDADLREVHEHFLSIITKASELFNIPQSDHMHVIFELTNILETYNLIPTPETYKNYLLFNARDDFSTVIYKENFPIFYQFIEEEIIKLCKSRNLFVNQYLISNLIFTLLSKWNKLFESLYKNFFVCRVLVYNHISPGHAINITEVLNSRFSSSVTTSLYKETKITEERLAEYNFDILISSITLDFYIPQPIYYLWSENINVSFELLRLKVLEIIKDNKEKQLEIIKSKMEE
ncbi:helix-turn-helix domain-containing protein [Jeotgalibaca porci]|uniref:helix-turn-helix domain-containing protein n=1 Tax=Jeotgalibaca porci TaxID=1868793 RepID=UPI00359F94A7